MSTQHAGTQQVDKEVPATPPAPEGKRRLPPRREKRLALLETKLRAERVELKLREIPGWTRTPEDRREIARAREFKNVGMAAAFATYAALAAQASRLPVDILLAGRRILVTIQGELG